MLRTIMSMLTATCLVTTNVAIPEDYIPSDVEYCAPTIIQEQVVVEQQLENNFMSYVEADTIEELSCLLDECAFRMDAANQMIEGARDCGYEEDHPIIELGMQEYERAKELYDIYKAKFSKISYSAQYEKYPVATIVWRYLKDELGYNNYVCAGIIGNLMSEVGGQTLDLQYWLNNGKYAGMCQWSLRYFPIEDVVNDLMGQCQLLADTIEENFQIFGSNYRAGFTYKDFTKLQSVSEATVAYEKCYGRGGIIDYSQRLKNAAVAYEFFVG